MGSDDRQDTPPEASGETTEAPEATAQKETLAAKDVLGSLGVVDTLKESLADYIQANDIGAKEGTTQLNLDWDFVRNHGGPLVAHMFQSLTRTILPDNVNFKVPTATRTKDGEKSAPVEVNFDLGDFLGKLFRPAAGKGDRDGEGDKS